MSWQRMPYSTASRQQAPVYTFNDGNDGKDPRGHALQKYFGSDLALSEILWAGFLVNFHHGID